MAKQANSQIGAEGWFESDAGAEAPRRTRSRCQARAQHAAPPGRLQDRS